MADSATGGYLVGAESTIEGQTLDRFLNSFLSGITGLNSSMVRPMWQPNPPKIPSAETDWMGYGIIIIESDDSAYVEQHDTSALLKRSEFGELSLMCYGTNAFINIKKVRDALQIGQNREYLNAYGLAIKGTKNIVHTPELVGDIWYNRVDMVIEFAREIITSYNILSIQSANGLIKTEKLTVPFKTN